MTIVGIVATRDGHVLEGKGARGEPAIVPH
jgi:hypothetical protein